MRATSGTGEDQKTLIHWPPEFTINDLLAELAERIPQLSDEAMTTKEIAWVVGLSANATCGWLRPYIEEGAVVFTDKKIVMLNGRRSTVTAWAINLRGGTT